MFYNSEFEFYWGALSLLFSVFLIALELSVGAIIVNMYLFGLPKFLSFVLEHSWMTFSCLSFFIFE